VAAARDLDYSSLVRRSRKLGPSRAQMAIRLAILSDAASQQFVPLLRTLFHDSGIAAGLYEGAFDGIEIEAYNSASGLYEFDPEVIVLANCTQACAPAIMRIGTAISSRWKRSA
jgi:hypothetical protein